MMMELRIRVFDNSTLAILEYVIGHTKSLSVLRSKGVEGRVSLALDHIKLAFPRPVAGRGRKGCQDSGCHPRDLGL